MLNTFFSYVIVYLLLLNKRNYLEPQLGSLRFLVKTEKIKNLFSLDLRPVGG